MVRVTTRKIILGAMADRQDTTTWMSFAAVYVVRFSKNKIGLPIVQRTTIGERVDLACKVKSERIQAANAKKKK